MRQIAKNSRRQERGVLVCIMNRPPTDLGAYGGKELRARRRRLGPNSRDHSSACQDQRGPSPRRRLLNKPLSLSLSRGCHRGCAQRGGLQGRGVCFSCLCACGTCSAGGRRVRAGARGHSRRGPLRQSPWTRCTAAAPGSSSSTPRGRGARVSIE